MLRYDVPVKLRPTRVWRTYIGGSRIDALHGVNADDGLFPEEWIISMVTARNSGREAFPDEGMCFLEDEDISLSDYIAANPEASLGAAHCRAVGETTGVLVKLIDAGERLTVQAHPDKETARRLFHSAYGKTECWHIVDGREINGEPPCIYMGFREGITEQEWRRCYNEQDIPAMLAALHRFDVTPGETYLIHGGVPHAIGAGCLLIEIQEPTDYTIRTERITPNGLHISDFMIHQGIGEEHMFEVFHYTGLSAEEARQRWCIPPRLLTRSAAYTRQELVGYEETACFRLERYDVDTSCEIENDDTFCGLYVTGGSGTLSSGDRVYPICGGDQLFVPAQCHTLKLTATRPALTVFRCFGPRAD